MNFFPCHNFIESRQKFRINFFDNSARFCQISFGMSMNVLIPDGFNVIIPDFRQNHIGILQKSFVIFPLQNLSFALFNVAEKTFVTEIPAIMTKPQIITLQIFPRPIKSGEFRIINIFFRNIVAGIVAGQSETFFSFFADVQRHINIIVRKPIFFVSRHQNFYVQDFSSSSKISSARLTISSMS